MKKILHINYTLLLLILVSLLSLQTVFSGYVICLGEDGHINIDISITDEKLATNHHMEEYIEYSEYADDTVIFSDKHFHRCYDIQFSFDAEFAKFSAKISPSFNSSSLSVLTLLFQTANHTVYDFKDIRYTDTSAPPLILSYLSANISLLI